MSPERTAAIAAHQYEIDKLLLAARCHVDCVRRLMTEPEETQVGSIADRIHAYRARRAAGGSDAR